MSARHQSLVRFPRKARSSLVRRAPALEWHCAAHIEIRTAGNELASGREALLVQPLPSVRSTVWVCRRPAQELDLICAAIGGARNRWRAEASSLG
jgi:hypothetical protein